jgi:hypothetical protein
MLGTWNLSGASAVRSVRSSGRGQGPFHSPVRAVAGQHEAGRTLKLPLGRIYGILLIDELLWTTNPDDDREP